MPVSVILVVVLDKFSLDRALSQSDPTWELINQSESSLDITYFKTDLSDISYSDYTAYNNIQN